MGLIRLVLGGLVFLVSLSSAHAGDCVLRVAVAASFRPVLLQLLPEFERDSQCRVSVSSGSSGSLYLQALHGAPFDLFMSADRDRPHLLEENKQTVAGSRHTYALGLLALWHPSGEAGVSEQLNLWPEKIVLADPATAPFGIAAKQALQALRLWDSKQAQLARAHNAGQAYLMLDSGNARMGFVAASQMLAAGRKNFWLVPQEMYQPIEQQLVVMRQSRNPDAARALADYLLTSSVQERLQALGYARAAQVEGAGG